MTMYREGGEDSERDGGEGEGEKVFRISFD